MRRLICGMAVAALALIAVPVAVGDGGGPGNPPPDGWFITGTVNSKATLSQHGLIVNVSGTYQCAAPVDQNGNDSYGYPIDPNNNGMGFQVTEIVGKQVLSTQGDGIGSVVPNPFNGGPLLTCDGQVHTWSAHNHQAPQTQNGQLGLFKAGSMIVAINGGINDTGDPANFIPPNGVGFGNQNQFVVKATG